MKKASPYGKHRAPGRAVTPLTILARNATASMDTVGRKSVVAVAASSMLATLVAVPAHADTNDSEQPTGGVSVSTLTASLRTALDESPEILVADGAFAIEAAVTEVKPAPVVRRTVTTRTSNTSTKVSRTVKRVDPMSIEAEGKARQIVDIALQYQGYKYTSGGKKPSTGFDCSGFTQFVYGHIGISLSSSSSGQKNAGVRVSRADAQPGDLIWTPGHVGIYLGNGKQIDAPRPGKTIQVRGIWQKNPTFLRVIQN